MSKSLIITEKPSVAREFAKVLRVSGQKQGCIENDQYVITWCYGHLVEMLYPESYDAKYKKWNIEDLPFLPEVYKYGVIKTAADQYKVVNSLLHREDIDTVYWAGDAASEGELIGRNIRNFGGVKPGMDERRVWIDSQTDEEIMRGIREAKPLSEYDLLAASGAMRAIEDYALGINFSRALSLKYGRLINNAAATKSYTAIAVGRVMTCVLGMVVRREREIRDFVETPFYRVIGRFSENDFSAEWRAVEGSKYFDSPKLYKENGFKAEETARELIDFLTGKDAFLSGKEISNSKKKAPLLFNLAELQSECSKRFKLSPAQTLDVVQRLYERKLTTYPRTDARVLSSAVAKEIHKNVRGLKGLDAFGQYAENILSNGLYKKIEKSMYTDDSKVSDHYAIIPTGYTNGADSLTGMDKAVYDLIVRRFLSIFYPPAEYKNVKVQVKIDSENFFASAKVLVKPGYLEIAGIPKSNNNDSDEADLKEDFVAFIEGLNIGDALDVNGFDIKEGKTNPPKRYTSGNLILAMENAGNLIEDEELRAQIKSCGIGTSATRAEIIEKLVRIGYLNLNNKTQIITPEQLGEMIYEVVVMTAPSLLNPEMSASWQKGLDGITRGTVDAAEYRSKLEAYIRRETLNMVGTDHTSQIAVNINPFTSKESKGVASRKPLGINCPVCGGELNKTAFGYGCSNYFNNDVKCRFSLGTVAGMDIDEDAFKKLITEGKTDIIDGFVGKNKQNFSAALKLVKDEEGKVNVTFDFPEEKPEPIDGLNCPICNGQIVSTHFGYSCENRLAEPSKCDFSIGKIADRDISLEEVTALIRDGHTDVLKGFKTKKKAAFNAKLALKPDEFGKLRVSFDFDGVEPDSLEGVSCPDCGGRIFIRTGGFACEHYSSDPESGCKFYVGKICGKAISAANVKELLTNGQTKTIRGFKSKNGKTFDACLILKEEEGRKRVAFDFDNVEAKVIKDVKCPVCGAEIIKSQYGFRCASFESGCKFSIGTIAGVKITETNVKALLTEGQTNVISGFKSKSGKKFDARLALDKDGDTVKGIKFVFDNNEAVIENVKCPVCGGDIIQNAFGYRCANNIKDREDSCKFFIGKVAGKAIDKEQVVKLLTEGKTDVIEEFLSKKGIFFSARLKLDEEKKIVFDFENV